tara:strand:- start:1561 stop:1725 length:165 start_codon:yes stop_codon:yes gene_type:complete
VKHIQFDEPTEIAYQDLPFWVIQELLTDPGVSTEERKVIRQSRKVKNVPLKEAQ